MPKRFTDTDKWKKPYIRGLQGAYKLLWLYILDDCDHAGIWQVDFEVASIRIGEQVNEMEAIKSFGDRIEIFNEGTKWFIVDFIDFQYGQLSEKNRMHLSVINILIKNKVGAYKPLPRGQGYGQGQGTNQGEGESKGQLDQIDNFNIEDKLKGALDEIYLDQLKPKWKHIDFDLQYQSFCDKVIGSPDHYKNHDTGGIRLAFQKQLREARPIMNGRQSKQTHDLT